MSRKHRHKMRNCSVNIHYHHHMMMGEMGMPGMEEGMTGDMERGMMCPPDGMMERGMEYGEEMGCMPERCRRCPYRRSCPGMSSYVCPGRY